MDDKEIYKVVFLLLRELKEKLDEFVQPGVA